MPTILLMRRSGHFALHFGCFSNTKSPFTSPFQGWRGLVTAHWTRLGTCVPHTVSQEVRLRRSLPTDTRARACERSESPHSEEEPWPPARGAFRICSYLSHLSSPAGQTQVGRRGSSAPLWCPITRSQLDGSSGSLCWAGGRGRPQEGVTLAEPGMVSQPKWNHWSRLFQTWWLCSWLPFKPEF